jgi:RimJ/RimL family protein N-acetyltransferase
VDFGPTRPNALQEWLTRRQSVVEGRQPLTIPVRLGDGTEIASLQAVTRQTCADYVIVDKFTRWRAANGTCFLTSFTPSPERTASWLAQVLSDSNRMLFMIVCNGDMVGHYGFRNLSEGSAELDNLLRGERGGHPRLMQASVRSLSGWLFDALDLAMVYGHILADNPLALKLHQDLGFTFSETYPLTLVTEDKESRWEIGPPGKPSPDGKYYRRVELFRRAVRGTNSGA